jgi:hypothetical protein
MQKGMDPATFTKMAQAGMSPDILKSYAAFLDPNMYTKWLAASMDPNFYMAAMAPLLNPNMYMKWMMPLWTPASCKWAWLP